MEDHGLLGFAGRQMELSQSTGDGSTVRDHMLSEFRQTGQLPELLQPVPCQSAIKYLWDYWAALNFRRPDASTPISYREIQAWCWLTGIRLSAFEMECLDVLERLNFKVRGDYLRRQQQK